MKDVTRSSDEEKQEKPSATDGSTGMKRFATFEHEVGILSRARHHAITHFISAMMEIDVLTGDPVPSIIMELIEGGSLKFFLRHLRSTMIGLQQAHPEGNGQNLNGDTPQCLVDTIAKMRDGKDEMTELVRSMPMAQQESLVEALAQEISVESAAELLRTIVASKKSPKVQGDSTQKTSQIGNSE